MNCLDTSVLVDYLHGATYIEELLDGLNGPVGIARLSRFELYVGAVRSDDSNETPGSIDAALGWTETLGFTDDAARDAAAIRAALLDAGEPIGPADAVIAGTARDADATLVTADDHFERVPGLPVRLLERENGSDEGSA